jgi:hypothetical protein
LIYLTYNDSPGGIYTSQVIDVVKYLNTIQSAEKVKLLALISLRNFSENRTKIKTQLPESIVIPMFPKVSLWKINVVFLFFYFLFSKHTQIIARGVFASNLALRLKTLGLISKTVFDARGAYHAELTEYNVISDNHIIQQIKFLENTAIQKSDYRLAVSRALVDYWKRNYSYSSNNHVIIPCTLGSEFSFDFPDESVIRKIKLENGCNENDIILVYSGSSAGWQSFDLLNDWLNNAFDSNPNLKLFMLTNHLQSDLSFFTKHKNRIVTKWLNPREVKEVLLMCDYGLMYRENTVTNQVASPVKFAEYLSCGLQIICSENLGDYSSFVKTNKCGFVLPQQIGFTSVDYLTKKRNAELCKNYLVKEVYKNEYLKLISCV